MRHVFLIGSNGLPASYGGYETFVDRLTAYKKSDTIQYHVSCLAKDTSEFTFNRAHCFNIRVPRIGPARAIYYDLASIRYCCRYIKEHCLQNAVIYVLGCGIGPFIGHYARKLHRLGARYFVNPDGLEWKRGKWKSWIRKYLKYSERQMVTCADLAICDSLGIEKYLQTEYKSHAPKTAFIAYGADLVRSAYTADSAPVQEWFFEKSVRPGTYYLAVGRFVPENNFETMLTEFLKSKTQKDLVLITNVEQNQYYEHLKITTLFLADKRIKFVGTVYDQELLKYIRENAYGYIHGHEVGGTNPSLLEALASTKLNLLLGVDFNREVGKDGAVYWDKSDGSLSRLLDEADVWSDETVAQYGANARERIIGYYNWENISKLYEKVFEEH